MCDLCLGVAISCPYCSEWDSAPTHVEKTPESVNIPALTSEELMAPQTQSEGEETSPYVPALQAESRKEKAAAIAAAMLVGLMLGYCILY